MKRNWITTSLGSLIIIGAVITVFIGKADWATAVIGIGAGVGLIFSKDHDK